MDTWIFSCPPDYNLKYFNSCFFLLQGKAGKGKHMAQVIISSILALMLLLKGTDTNCMAKNLRPAVDWSLASSSSHLQVIIKQPFNERDFKSTWTVISLPSVMGELLVPDRFFSHPLKNNCYWKGTTNREGPELLPSPPRRCWDEKPPHIAFASPHCVGLWQEKALTSLCPEVPFGPLCSLHKPHAASDQMMGICSTRRFLQGF